MRTQILAIDTTPERRSYLLGMRRRVRRATWSIRARYWAIHLSWVVVLVAGAAISLVEAFDYPRTVGAVLGFVVVVVQGIERVFGRTSAGAEAMDAYRRRLDQEQRLLLARSGPYAEGETDRPVDVFIERCEQLVTANDERMTAYYGRLAAAEGAD